MKILSISDIRYQISDTNSVVEVNPAEIERKAKFEDLFRKFSTVEGEDNTKLVEELQTQYNGLVLTPDEAAKTYELLTDDNRTGSRQVKRFDFYKYIYDHSQTPPPLNVLSNFLITNYGRESDLNGQIMQVFKDIDSKGLLEEYKKDMPPQLQSLFASYNVNSFSDLYAICEYVLPFDHAYALLNKIIEPSGLTRSEIDYAHKVGISPIDAEFVKKAGIDILNLRSSEDFKRAFDAITSGSKNLESWINEWKELDITNFRAAGEIFGYDRMFKYIRRYHLDPKTHEATFEQDISTHDAIHAFPDVLKLYEVSGLTPDEFWANILHQVSLDRGRYKLSDDDEVAEYTSYDFFIPIAQTILTNWETCIQLLEEAKDTPEVSALASEFQNPKKVFESWNNLKRFAKLAELLQKKYLLIKLNTLGREGKKDEKKQNYINGLQLSAFIPIVK